MHLKTTIEEIDATRIRMIVEVIDDGRTRSRRTYNIAKSPNQEAEAVCREACPEAFSEAIKI